jgi:hypothetical protein
MLRYRRCVNDIETTVASRTDIFSSKVNCSVSTRLCQQNHHSTQWLATQLPCKTPRPQQRAVIFLPPRGQTVLHHRYLIATTTQRTQCYLQHLNSSPNQPHNIRQYALPKKSLQVHHEANEENRIGMRKTTPSTHHQSATLTNRFPIPSAQSPHFPANTPQASPSLTSKTANELSHSAKSSVSKNS